MKISITDTIASIALIVSFISIFLQRKDVNKQLTVTNICEYTKRYQEIIFGLPENVLDDKFDINSFSEKEKVRILRYMWLYFDLCYEEYNLYHNLKLINKKVWNMWELGIKTALCRPAFVVSWKIISRKTTYGNDDNFVKFINRIVNNNKCRLH